MKIGLALLVAAGCAHGIAKNHAVAKTGRHVEWQGPVAATFCAHCGTGPLVEVTLGSPPRARLAIPSCYAHAHQVLHDHDNLHLSLLPDDHWR